MIVVLSRSGEAQKNGSKECGMNSERGSQHKAKGDVKLIYGVLDYIKCTVALRPLSNPSTPLRASMVNTSEYIASL